MASTSSCGFATNTAPLARAVHSHLGALRSQCAYSAENEDWSIFHNPFVLPAVWHDNELALARLLGEHYAGLQAVRSSQISVRKITRVAGSDLRHLATATAGAIDAIDRVSPELERLLKRKPNRWL